MKYAIKKVQGVYVGRYSKGTGKGSTKVLTDAKMFDSEVEAVSERDTHVGAWRSGTIIVEVKQQTVYVEA